MRTGWRAGLLMAMAMGWGAPAASAAPTWLAPFDLDGPLEAKPSGGGYLPSMSQALVGQDDNGDVFVLTREWDGSNVRVALVERLRDGTIHKQLVSPAGTDVNGFTSSLAVAATGAVIVGWQNTSGGPLTVATGQAGQDLVVAPSFGVVSTYSVAAGQGGDLAVAFTPSLNAPVQVARQAPGGSLGAPVAIAGSSSVGQTVAITPAGETVVAWSKATTAATNRFTYEVDWSAAPRGAAFSVVAQIPGSAGTPPSSDNSGDGGQISALASDGAGTVHALYGFGHRSGFTPTTDGDAFLASRPAGGAFTAGAIIPGTHINEIVNGGQLWADRAGDLLFSQSVANKVFVARPARHGRPGSIRTPGTASAEARVSRWARPGRRARRTSPAPLVARWSNARSTSTAPSALRRPSPRSAVPR